MKKFEKRNTQKIIFIN